MVLGVCDRTFRRYLVRYDEGELEALMDKRLTQASHRCVPVDEVPTEALVIVDMQLHLSISHYLMLF